MDSVAGLRSSFISICFVDPPENTSLSSPSISVEEGKIPPRIVCSSRAYPEPEFSWWRNAVNIVNGSSLIVNTVMERSDAGVYTCVASNKHGNHSTDAVIDIHCTYAMSMLLRVEGGWNSVLTLWLAGGFRYS